MAQPVQQNNKGFTLLETMIALLILTVMMLGTLQALIGTYQMARNNTLRDHAVKLADNLITDFRNTPYNDTSLDNATNVPAGAGNGTVPVPGTYLQQINNGTITYTATATISEPVSTVAKNVQLVVTWTQKGNQYNHTTSSIVANK